MNSQEDATFMAIIRGEQEPDPALVQAGRDAYAAKLEFHMGPRPCDSVRGLCWRLGWNEAALAEEPVRGRLAAVGVGATLAASGQVS